MKRAYTFAQVQAKPFPALATLFALTLFALLAGYRPGQPVAAAPDDFAVVRDRAKFLESWNNWLEEDFEEGNVKPGTTSICGSLISYATADECFKAGDIVTPLILAVANKEDRIVLAGADQTTGRTKAVGAESASTVLEISLKSQGAYHFGLEIWFAPSDPAAVQVSFYDSEHQLITRSEVRPLREGAFIGLIADKPIQSIALVSDTLFLVEDVIFADSSLVCNDAGQGFENGIPLDWEVINNAPNIPVVWSTSTGCGEGVNYTGAAGEAACASSDLEHGGNSGLYDTELRTPRLDFSGQTFVHLDYLAKFASFAEQDVLDLDISLDGGATWQNVLHWGEDHPSGTGTHAVGGEEAGVDLSPYIGQKNVRLRWRYYDPAGPIDSPDWYAQIDDVALTCAKTPDLAVAKTVGTEPAVCATTSAIEAPSGTEVTYCYELTNNGAEAVSSHTLFDNHLGDLGAYVPSNLILDPGQTYDFTVQAVITKTTQNTAWWSAETAAGVPTGNHDTALVSVPALDYGSCVDFESGALPLYMVAGTIDSNSSLGRVEVSSAYPYTGSYALNLDTDCADCSNDTSQWATLTANLAGQTDVQLDFWVMGHDDDPNGGDFVQISDDGGQSWANIYNLAGRPNRYENIILDLDQATADAGLELIDGFLIRFLSTDNYYIPLDGFSFDDICLTPTRPKIELETLVGLNPNACGPWPELSVPAGAQVTACYRVTNTGPLTLTRHTLQSSAHGAVLVDEAFDLASGATTWLTRSLTVNNETHVTANWYASDPPGSVPETSDFGSALVSIGLVPQLTIEPQPLVQTQPPATVRQKSLTFSNPGSGILLWWLREDIPLYGWSQYGFQDSRFVVFETGSVDPFVTVAQVFPRYFDAGDFLGHDFDTLYALELDTNTFYTLDTTTGAVSLLGPAHPPEGYNHWVALSGHPDGDKFYALGTFLSGGAYTAVTGLFTIEPFSGRVELLTPVTPPGGTCCLGAMAVHPGTGVIYAMHAGSGHDAELVTIDPDSGVTTSVYNMGGAYRFPMAMDFDEATGLLYFVARHNVGGIDREYLYRINVAIPLGQSLGQLDRSLDVLAIANSPDFCQPDPPHPPWAEPTLVIGALDPGQSTAVPVEFDSGGLPLGSYEGQLCFDSNAFGADPFAVPVSLKVLEPTFLPVITR